jgi:HAD superfamily hydrolase (TIGR01509 family)
MSSVNEQNQSKYELLILDYGGTYSFEYDITNFDKIIQKTFSKIPNSVQKVAIEQLSHRLAADSITTGLYIQSVAEILDTQVPDVSVFEAATLAVTNPPSLALHQLLLKVKAYGIRVSLLSNMYKFEVLMTTPWGRYDDFDYISFSATAKMTKSDPAFFQNTLDHFGTSPEKVLFVDDIAEYIKVAEKLGIHSIHADKAVFTNPEQLAGAIRSELFQVS